MTATLVAIGDKNPRGAARLRDRLGGNPSLPSPKQASLSAGSGTDQVALVRVLFGSSHKGQSPHHRGDAGSGCSRSPEGIRTLATALRGRRPRPLDDGALGCYTALLARQ